ncbi:MULTISPECIES: hypothetical protein [unclassified Chryseobacterium]|uniref:hypothetical protein n=1 Tax=unclassified Chryseobacterium TaxID=2593645 RepID=UPI00301985B7
MRFLQWIFLAQIAAASFFVATCASLWSPQKRYSGKLEIASDKNHLLIRKKS